LEKHTFANLIRRLTKGGFKNDFIQAAILPDWWNEVAAQDPSLLPDIEIRVSRFLGIPLSSVQNPKIPLLPPIYPNAQLRRVKDINRDKLAPAIHSAIQIAGAVVRNLRRKEPSTPISFSDGLKWRDELKKDQSPVTLNEILADIWNRGIPVVPLELIPAPSFQGLACIVEGNPVVLISHRQDELGRLAFWIAHEVGHIVAGDCSSGQPVIDESEDADDSDIEVKADLFAKQVLVGNNPIPLIDGEDFKQLASRASKMEQTTGIEASQIIFAWASQSHDYATATRAVQALYRGSGARRLLSQYFNNNIKFNEASESDSALLQCVYGVPRPNATPN